MLQSGRACRTEVAQFKLFVMQQDVLDLDVPVRNRWLLVVHLKQASAGVLHDVHNLLLAETFASEPYNQVE